MRLLVSLLIWILRAVFTSRRSLVNATTSPGLAWVKQQIRQVTAWATCPRFLLHDNDGVYHQRRVREGQTRRCRCHLDLWLAEVMGIEGLPIPYGAPNASPHIERFNRTLREEALNHFIFLDAKHVLRVCREYVEFYNRARPSQALHAIPEPYPELVTPPRRSGELIALLGLQM
jgi:putative transposase